MLGCDLSGMTGCIAVEEDGYIIAG